MSIVSNRYQILAQSGEVFEAIAMGKCRLGQQPMVGDRVLVSKNEHQYGIEEILPRTNRLFRPNIANVDQVLIVMSCIDPDFHSLLCDKMIFKAALAQIKPILLFSKLDLVPEDHRVYEYIKDYQKSGYEVILLNQSDAIDQVKAVLKDKISVLSGNSGVGKSTLLNRLDPNLLLKTQAISKALGRGKHTTTKSTLFPIENGLIADTPGFSTITFEKDSKSELSKAIVDFQGYLDCKFTDCLHVSEPNCHVKMALKQGLISPIRYQNYLKILEEIKEN